MARPLPPPLLLPDPLTAPARAAKARAESDLRPTLSTEAPAIAWHEPWKEVHGHRCREVIANWGLSNWDYSTYDPCSSTKGWVFTPTVKFFASLAALVHSGDGLRCITHQFSVQPSENKAPPLLARRETLSLLPNRDYQSPHTLRAGWAPGSQENQP